MTPEERARRAVTHAQLQDPLPKYDADDLRASIANMIREAVAAEREACARVAEAEFIVDDGPTQDVYMPFNDGWHGAAHKIATAIRSRGET